MDKILPEYSFLQAEQCQFSQTLFVCQMLPSLHHLYGLLSLSLLHWVRSPELDPELQMFTGAEQMGIVTSLDLRATLFVMQPRGLLASS